MYKYIYLDESGDLGLRGSRYLVISALIINNPKEINRIIKNMRRNKFKKQLKKAYEIKANKSSEKIVKHMLKKLNEIEGAKIFHVILKKKSIQNYNRGKDKLYDYVAGKLAKNIILDAYDVEIRVDKSKGKQILQEDFNKCFLKNLHKNSRIAKTKIYHSYSHGWAGLQFADVLAWSCFQKYEHSNSEYMLLIKLEQKIYHIKIRST
ncbi:MAG: DUF3800 domain-containing protein [Candidatus Woesearchaeota archaeon]